MPCYFHGIESPSFPPYFKWKKGILLRFFTETSTLWNRFTCDCLSEPIQVKGQSIYTLHPNNLHYLPLLFSFTSLTSYINIILTLTHYLKWHPSLVLGWILVYKKHAHSNEFLMQLSSLLTHSPVSFLTCTFVFYPKKITGSHFFPYMQGQLKELATRI